MIQRTTYPPQNTVPKAPPRPPHRVRVPDASKHWRPKLRLPKAQPHAQHRARLIYHVETRPSVGPKDERAERLEDRSLRGDGEAFGVAGRCDGVVAEVEVGEVGDEEINPQPERVLNEECGPRLVFGDLSEVGDLEDSISIQWAAEI